MLSDTTVDLISIASRKTIRKWVVCGVKYDFDHDWYSYHEFKLGDNEYCEFGTPFGAYKHAKNLVNKYRKTYSDAVVVIVEKVDDLQRKIDKAIEYIINHTQSTAHLEMDTKSTKELLDILRGDE